MKSDTFKGVRRLRVWPWNLGGNRLEDNSLVSGPFCLTLFLMKWMKSSVFEKLRPTETFMIGLALSLMVGSDMDVLHHLPEQQALWLTLRDWSLPLYPPSVVVSDISTGVRICSNLQFQLQLRRRTAQLSSATCLACWDKEIIKLKVATSVWRYYQWSWSQSFLREAAVNCLKMMLKCRTFNSF